MSPTRATTSADLRLLHVILLVSFFVSGACGLVYEIVWLRVLGLIFGNTTLATSAVLSGFMAGLGLGALYFGKKGDSARRPARLYALLEAGIGVFAVLTPLMWVLLERFSIAFYGWFHPSYFWFSVFKFVACFIVLLIPTFLMGGTLPVLSVHFVRRNEETTRKIGFLYALNTTGAVLGVLASGFYLLYEVGVWQTAVLTGCINLLIAGVCFAVTRREVISERENESKPAAHPMQKMKHTNKQIIFLILFAVSGGTAMLYEVVWTRVLAMLLGSSVYAFSVMLATFLLGIALGSYGVTLLGRFARAGEIAFAAFQLLISASIFWGMNQFEDMPYYFVRLFAALRDHLLLLELVKILLCAIVMFPPTLLMGAMFACFIQIYRSAKGLGGDVGEAYFANTVGNIAGSVLTGFLWIPWLGLERSLVLGAATNAVIGAMAFVLARAERVYVKWITFVAILLLVAGSGFTVEPWDRTLLTGGTVVSPGRSVGISKFDLKRSLGRRELLFYQEGLGATVSVTKVRDRMSLAINGKVDASDGEDAFTQFLIGHLPLLLHPEARNALVIGVGSASTIAAVASHGVERIVAVELEKAVVEAAHYFSTLNRDVLSDPRVEVVINDGRNYLWMNPEKFDVIISQPSNPWLAGIGNLFSLEYYREVREKLREGGVMCQWIQAYNLSPEDLRMVIRTFREVFPDVTLWSPFFPDLVLIGQHDYKSIDFNKLHDSFNRELVRKDFESFGIRSAEGVFSCFFMTQEDLHDLTEGAALHTDNRPLLEFSAPKALYRESTTENLTMLRSFRKARFPEIVYLEPPLDENADFHIAVARGLVAKMLFDEANEEAARALEINRDHPEAYELLGRIQAYFNRLDAAAALILKSLELDPSNAEAHFQLSQVFRKKRLIDVALSQAKEAYAGAPQRPEYILHLAELLDEHGQRSEALKLYNDFIALKGMNYDVGKKAAQIMREIGTFDEKVMMGESLVRRYRYDPDVYDDLAKVFEKQGEMDAALGVYLRMKEALPNEIGAYLGLARMFQRLGDMESFKKATRDILKLDPTLSDKLPTLESNP